jgi:hypothetical protein
MDSLFILLATLAAQTPVTTEYITRLTNALFKTTLNGTISFVLSWVVGIGSVVIAIYTTPDTFGVFPFAVWWQQALFYGAIVSAAANGIFQLDAVKRFLALIQARKG